MSLADLGLSLPALPRKPGSRQSTKWITKEDNLVRKGFREGKTDEEMGIELQRSASSIANRRYTLKLLRDPVNPKANIRCKECGDPVGDPHSTRCRRCYEKVAAAGAGAFAELFSMVSKEETLENGVRRRLYGDLRGL